MNKKNISNHCVNKDILRKKYRKKLIPTLIKNYKLTNTNNVEKNYKEISQKNNTIDECSNLLKKYSGSKYQSSQKLPLNKVSYKDTLTSQKDYSCSDVREIEQQNACSIRSLKPHNKYANFLFPKSPSKRKLLFKDSTSEVDLNDADTQRKRLKLNNPKELSSPEIIKSKCLPPKIMNKQQCKYSKKMSEKHSEKGDSSKKCLLKEEDNKELGSNSKSLNSIQESCLVKPKNHMQQIQNKLISSGRKKSSKKKKKKLIQQILNTKLLNKEKQIENPIEIYSKKISNPLEKQNKTFEVEDKVTSQIRSTEQKMEIDEVDKNYLKTSIDNNYTNQDSIVVVDTNVLLKSNGRSIIDELRSSMFYGQTMKIIIPFMVLQELDKLKNSSVKGLSIEALAAIKWCNSYLENEDPCIQGEDHEVYLESSKFQGKVSILL